MTQFRLPKSPARLMLSAGTDCDPSTVTAQQLIGLRSFVAERVSETEAHRVVKVWRALWKKTRLKTRGFVPSITSVKKAFLSGSGSKFAVRMSQHMAGPALIPAVAFDAMVGP